MSRLRLLPALALLLLTGLGGCAVYPAGYYGPPAVVARPAPRYYYGPGYYRPYYHRPYGYYRRW
ncbi:hypothetical protein [Siccirubricoccus phaeus]|uniref:hypothetical protein n=1 Tax=Siccirubricoccus phaeus TaxID=2595053 RepID=UPI0011F3C1CC|nr:hypothetical protein [Siccirubricoccus phaeus]